MKKLLFSLSVLMLPMSLLYGQPINADSTSHWKRKLVLGLNINQAAFSANWKAGGVSSIGLNARLNGQVRYKKDRHSWDNNLDVLFGFVHVEELGYQKTLDRIYLDSKYGYAIRKNWDLFTSLNLFTQFAEGYDGEDPQNLISDTFTPAYITSAWGVAYYPVDYFKLRISPFAPRLTIVSDPRRFVESVGPVPYGVEPSQNTRLELFAFQLFADFDKEIAKNINLKWNYTLFANYETLSFEKLDHRIDLNLIAKIGKYINVSIGGILLYDYDQDKEAQLSQLFTFGLAYGIQNFEEEAK